MKFLCVLFALFVAAQSAQVPLLTPDQKNLYEDLIRDAIQGILDELVDPQPVNDTLLEFAGVDIILTAETSGLIIHGLPSLHITRVNVNAFTLVFDIGLEGTLFRAEGGLDAYIDSIHVWPSSIFGNGYIDASLESLVVSASGRLSLLPISIVNFDYGFGLGALRIDSYDGLMGGIDSPGHAEVFDHLNTNGGAIIEKVEEVNHENLRAAIEQAINDAISGSALNMKKF